MLKDYFGNILSQSEIIYDKEIPSYGDLMTVEEFKDCVQDGFFTDYDGHGNPVRDGKAAKAVLHPSDIESLPKDATHIVWYNK